MTTNKEHKELGLSLQCTGVERNKVDDGTQFCNGTQQSLVTIETKYSSNSKDATEPFVRRDVTFGDPTKPFVKFAKVGDETYPFASFLALTI